MTDNQDTWPAGATAVMNVTYTQANAAGGAMVCEITPGTGNEFILMAFRLRNSGTNGLDASLQPTVAGASAIISIAVIGSGAGTACAVGPGAVSTTAATTTASASGLGYPLIVSGPQTVRFAQSAAGAQNDTFTVICNIRAKGAMPTVIHSNSTNPGNVTVTAGAESFAPV